MLLVDLGLSWHKDKDKERTLDDLSLPRLLQKLLLRKVQVFSGALEDGDLGDGEGRGGHVGRIIISTWRTAMKGGGDGLPLQRFARSGYLD